jgi:hypothetical protein
LHKIVTLSLDNNSYVDEGAALRHRALAQQPIERNVGKGGYPPFPLAGNGVPLNWPPTPDAVAGNGWDGGKGRVMPLKGRHPAGVHAVYCVQYGIVPQESQGHAS